MMRARRGRRARWVLAGLELFWFVGIFGSGRFFVVFVRRTILLVDDFLFFLKLVALLAVVFVGNRDFLVVGNFVERGAVGGARHRRRFWKRDRGIDRLAV